MNTIIYRGETITICGCSNTHCEKQCVRKDLSLTYKDELSTLDGCGYYLPQSKTEEASNG